MQAHRLLIELINCHVNVFLGQQVVERLMKAHICCIHRGSLLRVFLGSPGQPEVNFEVMVYDAMCLMAFREA